MYNFHLEIKFLDNEYWWGGAVDEGIFMPYINNYPLADLNDNNFGNQATSFFISSKGRYFYSDEPIRYEIKDKIYAELKINGAVVQTGEGQRTATNPKIKKMFSKLTALVFPFLSCTKISNLFFPCIVNSKDNLS